MSQHNQPITLAIVEDHPIVIEGLKKILEQDEMIGSIQEYYSGKDFTEAVRKKPSSIDVALLDITLPDSNGVDICREIKSISPEIIILGFSNHNDRSIVLQLLHHGANGYILKNASATEIIQCIREALTGQITFSKQIAEIMAKPSSSKMKQIPPLTKREKQILYMVADGKTSLQISDELTVSPLTVETHRRNLMQKLDAKNVAELIKVAMEMKLL